MKEKIKKFFRYVLYLGILIFIDFIIKFYTHVKIPKLSWSFSQYPYGGIKVFRDFFGISFSINHVENLGAAWGILSSYTNYLFYFRIAIVSFLIFYALFLNKDKRKAFSYILIISGAIGNIFDYLMYGHVIDMFHFNFWGYSYPIFNFADILISIGIFWLFVVSIFFKQKTVALEPNNFNNPS